MQKKTVISVIVIAMILVIALYFITDTYARYIEKFSGTSTASVAQWKVNGTQIQSATFTVEKNENVVASKIAPATKATASAELDLTGTEVSVDVIVEGAGTGEFDSKVQELGLNPSQMTFTVTKADGSTIEGITGSGTKDAPFVIKLQEGAALSGKLVLDLTIEWKDLGTEWDATEANNVKDTTVGRAGEPKTFELPLTVIVQQHID